MRYKSEENKEKAYSKLKIGRDNKVKKGLEQRRIYESNPKKCLECENNIPYEKRINTFCSRSCSTTYNNKNGTIGKQLTTREERYRTKHCLYCNQEVILINKRNNNFCDKVCEVEYRVNKSLKRRMKVYVSGLMNDYTARNFFREITEKQCSVCGLKEWMGKEIPVEVDHIDGNSDNNFPSNLRYVCCNCAALLPTYKGANKGNGRKSRRKGEKWLAEVDK